MGDPMQMFFSVMTSKHDEGLAACRELIRRNGDDEMALYAAKLIEEGESDDPKVMLRAKLATVGLFAAWLSLREEDEEGA